MASQGIEPEFVDLTQEGTSKDEPPLIITLNDSLNQPDQEQPNQQNPHLEHPVRRRDNNNPDIILHRPNHPRSRPVARRIEVVDVVDSEEESSSDVVEPARKRRNLSTSWTPRRRPPSITPATQRPRPESPDNSLKCPICIETFKNIKKQGTKCVVTKCGHLFCESCLKKALTQNDRKCPKCRKTLPRGPTAMIEVYDLC